MNVLKKNSRARGRSGDRALHLPRECAQELSALRVVNFSVDD
jgi:hypothetical protein